MPLPGQQPIYTEYRGCTVRDDSPTHNNNPYWYTLPNRMTLGAPTMEDAHQRIDAYFTKMEQPVQPGGMRILAVLPGSRAVKASTCRNRSEQASGQRRKGGRFA